MARRLEGEVDVISTQRSKREMEQALKRLDRIQKRIDDVSRSTLDPRTREQRIASLNKQLQITEASIRRLNNQKLDIQVDKEGRLQKFGRDIRGVGNIITAVWAGAAAQAIRTVASAIFDLADSATQLRKLTLGMDEAVKSAGVMNRGVNASVDGIIAGLDRVSKGMIKPLEAQEFFNLSLQLGLVKTQEQFEQLTQNALILGQKTGLSVKQSLDFITEGFGKASPEILNNAGIVFTAAEAYEVYSKQVGKSVKDLTEAERQTAKQQLAMQRLNEAVASFGGEQALVVDGNERLAASWERAKIAAGNLIALPVGDFLTGLSERLDNVASLTDVWADNLQRVNTIITATAGTDLGLEGVETGVERRVLEMDLTSLDEAIAKEKERLSQLQIFGDNQTAIADTTSKIADLEAQRVQTQEKLNTLTQSQKINLSVNNDLAKQIQENEAKLAKEQQQTNRNIAMRNDMLSAGGQEAIRQEQELGAVAGSVTAERIANERRVAEAHAENANRRMALEQEVASLEATIATKQNDAIQQRNKRAAEFWANETKRIEKARESGLKGAIGSLVSGLQGGLGDVIGEDPSRKFAEDLRRLEAVARGDIGGESAQLLKESGLWDRIFGDLDESQIQQKAIEVFNQFKESGVDAFGLVDVQAMADEIIEKVQMGAEGKTLQQQLFDAITASGELSPAQLDQAFGIVREQFSDGLDVSLVGEDERERIQELNAEIAKLGEDGSKSIDKIGEATDGLEEPVNIANEAWERFKATVEAVAKAMGIVSSISSGLGVTGGGGGEGQAGAGVASTAPPQTTPSPDTSFSIPPAPLPTGDFTPRTARQTTTQQPRQATESGGNFQISSTPLILELDGEKIANSTIPHIVRRI